MDDVCEDKALSVKGSNRLVEDQLWLWHLRFDHASFGYLQHLFPSLFSTCKPSNFKCDTCILAKIHCAAYPISSNKRFVPFALVHSDVWGPSPITTTSSFRWFVIFVDDCTT